MTYIRYPIIPGESKKDRKRRLDNERSRRYRANMTQEQKDRRNKTIKAYRKTIARKLSEQKWRRENREKYNAIKARASRKWYAKKKAKLGLSYKPSNLPYRPRTKVRIRKVGNTTIHRLLDV